MGSSFDAFVCIGIAHIGINEYAENIRKISVSAVLHIMQRYRGHPAVHSGNDRQNPHTGIVEGRSAIPERSLVPVRCFHGVLPLGVRSAAYLRNAWHFARVPLPHDPTSTATFDNDPLPESLPKIFDAKKSDQSDIQTIQPTDLQRHIVLPVLYVLVRVTGSTVLRRTEESLRS